MPQFLLDLFAQAKAIWKRLDGGQRMTIATVLLATAVGLGAIIWYAGQPSYVRLMEAKDAAEFDAAMAVVGDGPFAAKSNGLVIEVPSSQRAAARAALRKQGVLSSGADSTPWSSGMPSAKERNWRLWEQRKNLAERKIVAGSRGIRAANISAAQPANQRTVSARRNLLPAAATVSISMVPGADFRAEAEFAAASTATALGIIKSNVQVHDSDSDRRFSVDENGVDAGGASDFTRLRELWRSQLEARAMGVLFPVYQGKVQVTVNLDLDEKMTYAKGVNLPEGGLVPNREEKTTKSSEDRQRQNNATPGAGPGAAAPAGGSVASNANTAEPSSKTNDQTTKKEIDPSLYGVKTMMQMAPMVRRITASVVIDKQFLDDKQITDEAAFKKQVTDLVAHAIGVDSSTRPGDKVVAEVLQFADAPPPVEPPGPDLMAMVKEFGPTVGNILAVLLVIVFLKGLLKKVESKPAPVEEDPLALSEEEEENLAPEEVARRMRREIEKAINEDPASVSRMLENWLTEQKA